jgi:hypothetical protein
LGAKQLAAQLREAGVSVTVHDEIYDKTERDPWIFYDRGKNGMVVVTSDKTFMKSFPHMAAIALGNTTVFFFTKNNWLSEVRGRAFLAAQRRIFHALKKQNENFIGCISMDGNLTIIAKKPRPKRKFCDPLDWESYRRVCQSAGVIAEEIGDDEAKQADAASA